MPELPDALPIAVMWSRIPNMAGRPAPRPLAGALPAGRGRRRLCPRRHPTGRPAHRPHPEDGATVLAIRLTNGDIGGR
ncbi:hypothetical protein [Streptomyces spiralis]